MRRKIFTSKLLFYLAPFSTLCGKSCLTGKQQHFMLIIKTTTVSTNQQQVFEGAEIKEKEVLKSATNVPEDVDMDLFGFLDFNTVKVPEKAHKIPKPDF